MRCIGLYIGNKEWGKLQILEGIDKDRASKGCLLPSVTNHPTYEFLDMAESHMYPLCRVLFSIHALFAFACGYHFLSVSFPLACLSHVSLVLLFLMRLQISLERRFHDRGFGSGDSDLWVPCIWGKD